MDKYRSNQSYFNPLPSHEGRRGGRGASPRETISIHSPHTRGDPFSAVLLAVWGISIHSPHTRGDKPGRGRGQTRAHFNPLPSHEGRLCSPHLRQNPANFNPLPSHEGRPPAPYVADKLQQLFQSTPLTRGETTQKKKGAFLHAFQSTPLTRGETFPGHFPASFLTYFNPLPSHEGRLFLFMSNSCPKRFQSTPLTRGETATSFFSNALPSISIHSPHTRGDVIAWADRHLTHKISIHSPHTRGDALQQRAAGSAQNFNPLPSHEGRRPALMMAGDKTDFNPLPSHEGRQHTMLNTCQPYIFQSTPLTRGETVIFSLIAIICKFQSTPLTRGET